MPSVAIEFRQAMDVGKIIFSHAGPEAHSGKTGVLILLFLTQETSRDIRRNQVRAPGPLLLCGGTHCNKGPARPSRLRQAANAFDNANT